MTDLERLIDLLEAAEEGSRELDARVAQAKYGWTYPAGPKFSDDHLDALISTEGHEFAPFTTSIDAALTLVPEGWLLNLWQEHPGWCVDISTPDWPEDGSNSEEGKSMTAPLAICIAALKARVTLTEGGTK